MPSTPTALQQIDTSPLTRRQKSIIALAVTGNIAEFFDMFLIGFVVAILTKPWNLTGFEAGTILACSGLGTVLGAIGWGYLADRIGRRASFCWCVVMLVVFTLATLLVPERGWIMLALLRIGVGLGVGGLNIVSIPYVQEFVPARQRGLLAGLASVFIPAGLFLGSLAQRIVGENWHLLIALGALPVLLLPWIRRVPESPRFLQAHGRHREAREALAWALRITPAELGPLPAPRTDAPASRAVIARSYLRPLLIVSTGSFCFILGSFTVQSWGQTLLQTGFGISASSVGTLFMIVAAADLLGRLAAAHLADRIGRRPVMLTFGLLGALGCLIVAVSATDGTHWLLFFTGILITMTFGDGAFGILNAFGAEQFPNQARATGLGLGYGIGASAKIIGPALMGAMIGTSALSADVTLEAVRPAFCLFAALLACGGIIYLAARETRGVSLEEV